MKMGGEGGVPVAQTPEMSVESRARGARDHMAAERRPESEGEERENGRSSAPATDPRILMNQLREITGIQDPTILSEAIKASDNDIMQAVSFLTDECAKEAEESPARPSEDAAINKTAVVGYMNDKDDLQAAIALSLQESTNHQADGGGDCRERCPVCVCAENKSRAKRKRSDVWGNSPDPNDLQRIGDWPVGLKNIGNTCWFSAVIQSLFHLPEFRRLVQSYSISPDVLERCQSRSEKRIIAFMQELQCLFALMVGSNRKFVDPSAAVELLKDAFLSEEAQQQDVCEFTHKLLDWLEDAFQLAVCGACSRDKSENPMVQLFYGTFLNEGYREDKSFSNIETFGQYPLQVNGFNNLSECLEAAMLEKDLEHSQIGQVVQYSQERWFTKLPPVLTFELSRFEYNQSLGQPEKIHNKLEFTEIVYMDRYLYRNKELIRKKRRAVRRLSRHIDVLHHKLERYLKYGSGPSRCPLPDMLRYVLEFAHTKSAAGSRAEDVTASAETPADEPAPPPQNGLVLNGRCDPRSGDESPLPFPEDEDSSLQDVGERFLGSIRVSAPQSTTKEELRSVESCLQRWRAEVEQDIEDLKASMANLTAMIDDIYNEAELKQVPYRLHAVLVHEGQANAGHYWAYIYNHSRKCWLRYNDISVTEATWEELERDSYGGMRNASAYCLMYINNKLPHLIADSASGRLEDHIGSLPLRFVQYVRDDNRRYGDEVDEWEEAHSCKMPQMEPVVPSEEDAPSPCTGSSSAGEDSSRCLSSEHALIAKEQTALAITKTAEAYERGGVEAALNEAFHEEYSRLCKLAEEQPTPSSDPRLQHVLVYFFQNKAPARVIERTLLEQFADKNLSYDERSISIMKVARSKLKEIGPNDMDMRLYQRWHEDYSQFRKVSVYLLSGLELYQKGKYQEALTYLVHAYQSNGALLSIGANRGIDGKLIELYRRKCLLELNDMASKMFEAQEEERMSEGVGMMNDLIIPCMHLIVNDKISQEDLEAIEDMRSRWCSYLGQDINENLRLQLGQFLPRLLDCSNEDVSLKEPPKIRPHSPYDLCNRFTAIMESIHGTSTVRVK